MAKGTILVVDDEQNVRIALKRLLEDEAYQVILAANGAEAINYFKKDKVNLVITDVILPDISGLKVLAKIKEISPIIEVIMISGYANIGIAVDATKNGAYDFLEKPLSTERVLLSVRNAMERQRLILQKLQIDKTEEQRYKILGESQIVKSLLELAGKIAQTDSSVLITGETGTGKELFARQIYQLSKRVAKPFIRVNSAAIPTELVESELFGYEKGAFTGASASTSGKFELAHQGTIFLDEIADMSLATQSKILRVLQDGEVTRIGGKQSVKCDIRVIAATNKDIKEEVKQGRFREDLYYRLNVIPLHIPPLREHKEDIPVLINYYIQEFCRLNGRKEKQISGVVMVTLVNYNWPGNIRELKNIMERLATLALSEQLVLEDIPYEILTHNAVVTKERGLKTLKEIRNDFEREYIKTVLLANKGNITKTANVLKLKRSYLYQKMKQLKINYSYNDI
ncbi:MAG: sigma-54 dependent transcriptional regulator [Nitrospirota bacterium]